jgi:GTPase SAR1 family protein
MRLNAWDFGGQEIYHATHQFFLTNRSLFLLAWNVVHGYEQGKLYYWLDTIQALAPDSPVLLVATHVDQREADVPLSDLRRKYPQIIGQCEISNKTGYGVDELRSVLVTVAINLPLILLR